MAESVETAVEAWPRNNYPAGAVEPIYEFWPKGQLTQIWATIITQLRKTCAISCLFCKG